MKTWAIGDVHGCGITLQSLLHRLGPGQGDHVIFLGDIIDRGKTMQHAWKAIQDLQKSKVQVTLLRGNHEDALLNALEEEKNPPKRKLFKKHIPIALNTWKSFGGAEVLKSFSASKPSDLPADFLEFIASSRFYLELEKFMLVHAGFNFKHEPFYEDVQSMMWLREFDVDLAKTGGRRVLHGHVPVSLDLIQQTLEQTAFHFIDLDNGCVYRDRSGMGNLVALDLDTETLHIQPNIEPYQ